jgi:hypothetical protein
VRGWLFPVEADWYEWRQEPPLAVAVLVRVTAGAGGRVTLSGLRIDGTPSADLLRAIPVGRIEATANAQLAATYEPEHSHNGEESSISTRARPVNPPDGGVEGWQTTDPHRAITRARRANKTDIFYQQIAEVYLDLAQGSHRPASDIADTHGVPVTTAHRWVKEARRRGFLPPGRPGKTG